MSGSEFEKKPEITIQNVVASISVNQKLDLTKISECPALKDRVTYEPGNFPGLIFKLDEPKTALLIFSSGKFVCTGAKSSSEVIEAVNKVIKELEKCGIKIEGEPLIKIENMVASAKLNFRVDLPEATEKLKPDAIYEPEQFPGLIYRLDDPRVVFLIFGSGSLVCAGAKKEEDVYRAVYKLRRILLSKGVARF